MSEDADEVLWLRPAEPKTAWLSYWIVAIACGLAFAGVGVYLGLILGSEGGPLPQLLIQIVYGFGVFLGAFYLLLVFPRPASVGLSIAGILVVVGRPGWERALGGWKWTEVWLKGSYLHLSPRGWLRPIIVSLDTRQSRQVRSYLERSGRPPELLLQSRPRKAV